jgi:hypothetical protein
MPLSISYMVPTRLRMRTPVDCVSQCKPDCTGRTPVKGGYQFAFARVPTESVRGKPLTIYSASARWIDSHAEGARQTIQAQACSRLGRKRRGPFVGTLIRYPGKDGRTKRVAQDVCRAIRELAAMVRPDDARVPRWTARPSWGPERHRDRARSTSSRTIRAIPVVVAREVLHKVGRARWTGTGAPVIDLEQDTEK